MRMERILGKGGVYNDEILTEFTRLTQMNSVPTSTQTMHQAFAETLQTEYSFTIKIYLFIIYLQHLLDSDIPGP